MSKTESISKAAILSMLKKSQTKVIFPIITFGLLNEFLKTGKKDFIDSEVRKAYHNAVNYIQNYIGHKLHTGGKYYDAYPIRNLPRYGVLTVNGKSFEITELFQNNANELVRWLPEVIKTHIESKIGLIPTLGNDSERLLIAIEKENFQTFIENNIVLNPSNFEVFSFSILKVHLEKFACKIYRDTRTSAHDKGVDLSTNFGVVYQIKKLQLLNVKNAEEVYSEIKLNFDSERMNDGKVVLIIDDISKEVRNYLIDMKVQSISKTEILNICNQFLEVEDRMKILRVIYDEFRREYESQI
jgi:hypothetical protein